MIEEKHLFRHISTALCAMVTALSPSLTEARSEARREQAPPETESQHPFQMAVIEGDRHFNTDGQGQVVFTDDLTDVLSLSDGGHITVRAWTWNNDATTQLIEIRSLSGPLSRTYSVGGIPQPWNEEARRLLASNLAWLVRRSGLAAQSRTSQIFKARGVVGVLNEIKALQSDYVRRLYFAELFRIGRLDGEALAQALTVAGAAVHSPHEISQILVLAAPAAAHHVAATRAYLKATGKLSDYERRGALAAVLNSPGLTLEVASEALEAAATLRTDYEKTETLIAALDTVRQHATEDRIREAFFAATTTVQSDQDRRRLLVALMRHGALQGEMLNAIIDGAARMRSDYDRAELLVALVKTQPIEAGNHDAVVNAVERMRSPYDRDRVLAALARSRAR